MEVLPREIPDSIVIDISSLAVEGTVRIADVDLPESAVITFAPEEVIVAIAHARVEAEAPVGEGEEGTTEVEVVAKGKAKGEEEE
jgi:large subunit ribosomal protein L25